MGKKKLILENVSMLTHLYVIYAATEICNMWNIQWHLLKAPKIP